MSNVITVINMKGGVGKTTLSVNISYVLARFHQKKVLIVDIDPQFNATQYLVDQANILDHFRNKKTIFDIISPTRDADISLTVKRKAVNKPTNLSDYVINIKQFVKGRLDLIPSSLKLINFETPKRGLESLLKKFIDEHCKDYDYIIIDCPPTLSILTLSAYLASQYYLIPIKPDYLSSLGLPLLERGLQEYDDLQGHSLELLGIVFTMVDNKSNLPHEVMESLEEYECFINKSSYSTQVAKSVNSLDSFYKYRRFARYAEEFKRITSELINKI